MTRTTFAACGLIAAMLAMTGCSNSLKDENALLKEENQTLRDQLADRNGALDSANQELRDRDNQLASMRRTTDSGGNSSMSSGTTGFEGIEGVDSSVSGGEVTASVASDLLFDSGKTTLKANAKKSLDQVAAVLNSQYGGHEIRVIGHTDTDPIKKSGHKSNYHLGFERAFAVREYLVSKGVDSSRLSLASYGPDQPAGSKQQSRRVEITVIMH